MPHHDPVSYAVVAQLLDDNPCGHRHDPGLRDGMAPACKGCAEKAGAGWLWSLAQALSDLDWAIGECSTQAEADAAIAIAERRVPEIAESYRNIES